MPDAQPPNEGEITSLKNELSSLKEELRKYKAREEAEAALLQSPLFRVGKWVVSTVVLVGLVIWVGGSVYSGVQIKSIRDQSNETLRDIHQIGKSISDADARVRAFLTDKFSEVRDLANSSKGAIKRTSDSAALALQNEVATVGDSATKARAAIRRAVDSATVWISSERARAGTLLDVDRLPDLRTIREQISQLDRAAGSVSLGVMRSLLGFWFWIFLVFAIVTLACASNHRSSVVEEVELPLRT